MASQQQNKPARTSGPAALAVQTESFAGPLPHPQILEQYNRVIPEGALRVIKMAEDEGNHRRQIEKDLVACEIDDQRARADERKRGQYFGLFIGLATIICGTYATISGYQISGSIIGTTGVVGIVSVFIYGSKKQNAEN